MDYEYSSSVPEGLKTPPLAREMLNDLSHSHAILYNDPRQPCCQNSESSSPRTVASRRRLLAEDARSALVLLVTTTETRGAVHIRFHDVHDDARNMTQMEIEGTMLQPCENDVV